MPSPNNPSPSAEFLSHAQNPSIHDSNFSNISGHLISVTVVNPPSPGIFQPLAQSSSDNQDLQPLYGQVMKDSEYPLIHGPPAPGKSNNPFAPNRNDLGVTIGTLASYLANFSQADDFDVDPPFTNSSHESYSNSSSLWGDGPLQPQISAVSSCSYLISSYANIMTRNFPMPWDRAPGAPQIAASLAL